MRSMNDNIHPAFRNAVAVTLGSHPLGVHPLRLVWAARLRLVGCGLSPWERLHERLLWLSFITWLRQDVQDVPSELDTPEPSQ